MSALCASLLAGLAVTLWAVPAAAVAPASAPRSAADQAAAVHRLTDEGVRTMLASMGYELKIMKGQKDPVYAIKAGQLTILVSLSGNHENLWISANLAKLPEGKPVPAQRLLTLLADNGKIDPIHFDYQPGSRLLTLALRLENRDLTVKEVRNALDTFIETMLRTVKDWDAPHWTEYKQTRVLPLRAAMARLT